DGKRISTGAARRGCLRWSSLRNGSIGGIGHLGGGGGPLSEAPGPRHFGRARAIGATTREENIGGHQDRCGKIKPPASRGDTQRGPKARGAGPAGSRARSYSAATGAAALASRRSISKAVSMTSPKIA